MRRELLRMNVSISQAKLANIIKDSLTTEQIEAIFLLTLETSLSMSRQQTYVAKYLSLFAERSNLFFQGGAIYARPAK